MFNTQFKETIINTIKEHPDFNGGEGNVYFDIYLKVPNEADLGDFHFNNIGGYSFQEFSEATVDGDFMYVRRRDEYLRVDVSGIDSVSVDARRIAGDDIVGRDEFVVLADCTVIPDLLQQPVNVHMSFSIEKRGRIQRL